MYIVRQKETGTIIDHSISESDAHFTVLMYEHADKMDDIYEPDFYEVWNQETWIYDVNKKKYYSLEMFIPPFIDDNPDAIFIFQDIVDSENRLMLNEFLLKSYCGGEEFLEYWRETHVC